MTHHEDSKDFGRRRFLQGIAVVGGLAASGALISACGDDDDDSTDATTGDTAAPAATTGDSAAPAATAAAGAGSGLIGLTLNGLNDYTKGVTTGVYKALEGSGYDLEVVQVNYDAAQELAAAEAFIAKGVVGLVIQPNTAESAGAAAAAAKAKDIPTGNCIWPGPSDADQYFDGVAELDSVEGGRLIGQYLVDTATPGKIVVVQGVVGQGFSERIDEGLDEVLAGTGFEVVVREQAFFDRTQAVGVVETAFQAHPDISIIVAYSASMSNGIAQWLKDQGKDTVVHVSSDADEEMVTWLKTPYLLATRYYSSAQTGLIAANAVLAKLRGETPEFRTVISQEIATADNIDSIVETNPYMFMEYKDRVQNI